MFPLKLETHHLQNVKRSMIIDWTSWKLTVLMFLTIAMNCNVSLSLNLVTNIIPLQTGACELHGNIFLLQVFTYKR